MKILKIFFCLLLMIIIVSCANSSSLYTTDDDCTPPCFIGITPGYSDALEISKLLLSSKFVKSETVLGSGMIKRHWYPVSYSYRWEFINGGEGTVWLTGESESVYIKYIDPRVNLNQFIKIYGEPSKILIAPYWGKKTQVFLVYPEIGVVLDIRKNLSNNNTLSLRALDRISVINYINKSLFDTVIHYFVFGDEYEEAPESEIALIIQDWEGFGIYTSIDYWN